MKFYNKMKITEIRKKATHVKKLLSEHDMLEALLKGMVKAKEKEPELAFDETYYNNVVKRINKIKKELENIFK
jgi:hypothetical protein